MKIDVWSDYACPFCYIGKRRFEDALDAFPHKNNVNLTYRSFELDPNAPLKQDISMNEMLATKYGMSEAEAKQMNDNVGAQAKSVGLTFNFDKIVLTNTFDAHRLTHFAKTKEKDLEITEQLLHAYFTDGKNLSDEETLASIAENVGLEREEALEVIRDKNAYAKDVRTDQADAQRIGVRGVPYFVINDKYAISGAQPKETFLQALEKVWEEMESEPVLQDLSGDADDASCADGNCAVPTNKNS